MKLFLTIAFLAIQCHAAKTSVAMASFHCRITSDLEFFNSKGTVIKRILPRNERQEKNGAVDYRVVTVFGCHSGRYGTVIDIRGKCTGECIDEPPLMQSATAYLYDASGKQLLEKQIDINAEGADMVAVSSDDSRTIILCNSGLLAIDAAGKTVELAGDFAIGPRPGLSPHGRYGFAPGLKSSWLFFDLETKRMHTYSGAGSPEVDDDGAFKMWKGRAATAKDRIQFPGHLIDAFKFE